MGTWNFEIKSDDFVLDVIGKFNDHLKINKSVKKSTDLIISEYQSEINDSDHGPLFWIAIGEVQWKYGELDNAVLNKIKKDFSDGKGLEIWSEESNLHLQKRKKVVEKFIQKLEKGNQKPSKLPKLIIHPPIFKTGDCLSISTKNNLYTAALVLAENHELPEMGINTIASLNYLSSVKPNKSIFEKRDWLKLTHHNHSGNYDISNYSDVGWRKEKHRFEIIDNIPILNSDPTETTTFSGFVNLGIQILDQREWEETT